MREIISCARLHQAQCARELLQAIVPTRLDETAILELLPAMNPTDAISALNHLLAVQPDPPVPGTEAAIQRAVEVLAASEGRKPLIGRPRTIAPTEPVARLSVNLPRSALLALDRLAATQGQTRSDLARRVIIEALERLRVEGGPLGVERRVTTDADPVS